MRRGLPIALLLSVALGAVGCGSSDGGGSSSSTSDADTVRSLLDAHDPVRLCGHMTARYLDEEALGNTTVLDPSRCKAAIHGTSSLRRTVLDVKVDGATAAATTHDQSGEGNSVRTMRYHFVKSGGAWKLDYDEQFYSGAYHYNCGEHTSDQPACS